MLADIWNDLNGMNRIWLDHQNKRHEKNRENNKGNRSRELKNQNSKKSTKNRNYGLPAIIKNNTVNNFWKFIDRVFYWTSVGSRRKLVAWVWSGTWQRAQRSCLSVAGLARSESRSVWPVLGRHWTARPAAVMTAATSVSAQNELLPSYAISRLSVLVYIT